MQAELVDIRNHMAQYPPFDEMAEELLDRVVGEIEVVYFKAGSRILELGDPSSWLFMYAVAPLKSIGEPGSFITGSVRVRSSASLVF